MRFPIDAHVLHGAGATVMVDAQGGGYLSRDGVMLTRFCEWCDVPCGPRFYLRDSVSGGTSRRFSSICASTACSLDRISDSSSLLRM